MSILVVIPARSGSKGIPNKNLVDLGGKPLIQYSFETASELKNIDEIILSTDDLDIIRLAESYQNIKIPFIRPRHLSKDDSSMVSVVLHLIGKIKNDFEYIMLLQPTSPFRKVLELNEMIKFATENNHDSVVAVTKVWHHPSEYIYFDKDYLKFVIDPKNSTRRQNFKNVYFISGAAYIIKTSLLKNQKNFVNSESKIYELSDSSMIDIDLPFHLNLARGYNYITENDS